MNMNQFQTYGDEHDSELLETFLQKSSERLEGSS